MFLRYINRLCVPLVYRPFYPALENIGPDRRIHSQLTMRAPLVKEGSDPL
jgi:hypothetical protein